MKEHTKYKCKGWFMVVTPDRIFVYDRKGKLRLEIKNIDIDEDEVIKMVNNNESVMIDAKTRKLMEI